MKSVLILLLISITLKVYSQSCEQRLNNLMAAASTINNCEQLDHFIKVTFNTAEARRFGGECALYIADNKEKLYALQNKLLAISKRLNCSEGSAQNKAPGNAPVECGPPVVTSAPIIDTQQQAQNLFTTLNQYKDNPITYKKENASKSIDLTNADRNGIRDSALNQLSKVENFDEAEINNLFGENEGKIDEGVAEKAYYKNQMDGKYGGNPFDDLFKKVQYDFKEMGVVDIDVTINDKGRIIGVSTASKPSDEALNRLINDYVWDNYSKSELWEPAYNKSKKAINSELTYSLAFYPKPKEAVVNTTYNLKPNEIWVTVEQKEEGERQLIAQSKTSISTMFKELSTQLRNNRDDFFAFFRTKYREVKSIINLDFMDMDSQDVLNANTEEELMELQEKADNRAEIYCHGKFLLGGKVYEWVSGSGTVVDRKTRLVARLVE